MKQGSLPNLTDLAIGQHNNGANPTDSIQSSIPGGPPGSGSILQNNEESPISSVSAFRIFKKLSVYLYTICHDPYTTEEVFQVLKIEFLNTKTPKYQIVED